MTPGTDPPTGPGPLADPRALVGRWALRRTVTDRLAGELHRIDGELEVADVGPHLRWHETLTWHRADGAVPARRTLTLRHEDAGWWVRFEDGRPFHPWSPGERVVHPCRPDTYAGTVAGDLVRWTVEWEVHGPAKDYTMCTVLEPGPPA